MNNLILDYRYTKPITIIIFNRYNETMQLLLAISRVKPSTIFVISDGPRKNNNEDFEKVEKCRKLVHDIINWDCKIIKIYSPVNLGCYKRVVTGLNEVFSIVDNSIILEDDCIPTIDFFRFCEWGLDFFRSNPEIGLISGSNLVSDIINENSRNGFSRYINIWGWATWKKTWEKFDTYLTIMELQNSIKHFEISTKLEKLYWKELFKLSIYSSKIWDFKLQYIFFKYNLFSVYPQNNLVQNIGFGLDATHTSMKIPKYVNNNKPITSYSIMNSPPNLKFRPNPIREKLYLRLLWKFSFFNTIKLKTMNILRFYI